MMIEMTKEFAEMCVRYVDGELSFEEENDVLAMCERSPEHYRHLALAMIERRRVGQLLAEIDGLSVACDEPLLSTAEVSPDGEQRASTKAWMWLAVFAASLLCGAVLGYGIRGFDGARPGDDLKIAAVPELDMEKSAVPATTDSDKSERLSNDLGGEETLVNLARHLKPTPTLDEQAVRMLTDNGVDVQRHSHVFLFEVSDGRQLAIPAEFTFLRTDAR